MATHDQRSYAAGVYALDMDGKFAGWLQSSEGGHCKAEVVTEKISTSNIAQKHIGGVSYEDISVSMGTSMTKSFYEWLQSSVDCQHKRITSGAIITADYNFKEVGRLNFYNALITELGFPACDAAGKDAAKMTVKFTPEYTRNVPKTGSSIKGEIGKGHQKKWHPGNFRLEIDGLTNACKMVNKVEALTIKQKVVKNQIGEQRDYQILAANLEFPNLVFTVPESHSDELYKLHEDFVIKGNCTQDKEKTGRLTYLSSDMKELFSLEFSGLGIFSLTPDKVEAPARTSSASRRSSIASRSSSSPTATACLRKPLLTGGRDEQSRSPRGPRRWPFRPSIRLRCPRGSSTPRATFIARESCAWRRQRTRSSRCRTIACSRIERTW